MALDFPNSPTDGQVYTDKATGEQWVYESATNSWTSKGLVNTSGGTSYKGSLDITAAPPAGVESGWMYSALATGAANAGFSPGLTGTVTKGDLILFTGSEWTDTSHSVPDATAAVKGIDKKLWKKTGTALAPETAADTVQISAGTAALPGLTPVGDPDTGVWAPAADTVAVSMNGSEKLRIDSSGSLLVGTSSARLHASGTTPTLQVEGSIGASSIRRNIAIAAALPANFFIGRARGGAFEAVTSGDYLGSISFTGADGSAQIAAATIAAIVDGTPGANDMPGRLVFSTTADGASSPTERMTISSSGIVNIANTPTYADNTAAKAGGLVAGDIYRKADGTLMITF